MKTILSKTAYSHINNKKSIVFLSSDPKSREFYNNFEILLFEEYLLTYLILITLKCLTVKSQFMQIIWWSHTRISHLNNPYCHFIQRLFDKVLKALNCTHSHPLWLMITQIIATNKWDILQFSNNTKNSILVLSFAKLSPLVSAAHGPLDSSQQLLWFVL